MNTGKFLVGLLTGITAGATLGILFAPNKGSDTRKKISKKGNQYVGKMEDKFNSFVKKFNNKMDEFKKETEKVNISGKAKGKEKMSNATGVSGH